VAHSCGLGTNGHNTAGMSSSLYPLAQTVLDLIEAAEWLPRRGRLRRSLQEVHRMGDDSLFRESRLQP